MTVSFEQLQLNSNIYKALSACGYTDPTPVQAKSIPEVINGKDVVVSAQTGTGKTAAFVLPALHRLSIQQPAKKPRVLILTPTRELATQITKAASMYGKFLRFKIVSLVGGMPYHHQIKDLARGADILVATPGRLLDHMEQKRIDLSQVEMLVLDEADRMLDMGFIDDVQYIAKLTPSNRQTLLFSATLNSKLMTIVRHLLKNPIRIDLSNEKLAAPQIKQEMIKANNIQHKSRLLKHFLNDENIYKAIIFSATKINADKLANQLRDDGFAAAALHGDLRQNVRNRTLDQFRSGRVQFLVATDVAARGIDVSDITHVINYDLPRFCEDYVHRIGRTGRAGKEGVAISFVLPTDIRHLQRIERYMGKRIKLIQHVEINESAPRRIHSEVAVSNKEEGRANKKQDYSSAHKRRSRFGHESGAKRFENEASARRSHHAKKSNEKNKHGENKKHDPAAPKELTLSKKKFSSGKKNSWKNDAKRSTTAKNEKSRSFKKRPSNKTRFDNQRKSVSE